MNTAPLVSILLLTWNSAEHLPRCLTCLAAQTFSDFEVVIVDNGSSDAALENLEEKYPTLKFFVKKLETNQGFAAANNLGAQLAHGKWLALLNTDAFPEPDWLAQLLQAAQTQPEFNFFASRQLQASNPDVLDGIGDTYHMTGLAWRRGYNQPAASAGLRPCEVFSTCAAAALYLREKFIEAGGFDADYFSYFEDVDLSFRLRLLGGRCLYVPTAVVHHLGSASTGKASDFSAYYGHRNLVWTYFKDMPLALFWLYLPLHLLMNIYSVVFYLLVEKRSILLKAKIDALRGLPAILRKRRYVQSLRRVPVSAIWRVINRDLLAVFPRSLARKRLDE
jgi:GT2 family glycosyltransferase